MKKPDVLKNVTIELLNGCNSLCIHCYLNCSAPKKVEIKDVKRVVEQAALAGAMQITLTGGEPLLHPNIAEIVEYIKGHGMAVNLLTSFNIERGKWLEIIPLCDKIGISIYGSNRDVHDRITRINGSFERMINNLEYLVDGKRCVTLNMSIMKENIYDVEAMVAFAKKCNLPYRVNYILHGASIEKHQIGFNDIILLKKVYDTNHDMKKVTTNFMCTAGRYSLWVDVDLNVYPCVFFRMWLGNLYNQTLADIWRKSEKVGKIKKTVDSDFEKCQSCELKYICTPCIGENYNVNQDITIPSDFSCCIGEYVKCLSSC